MAASLSQQKRSRALLETDRGGRRVRLYSRKGQLDSILAANELLQKLKDCCTSSKCGQHENLATRPTDPIEWETRFIKHFVGRCTVSQRAAVLFYLTMPRHS